MNDFNDQDLEDFDSDDLETVADADHGYLGSMWSGQGFRRGGDLAKATVVAHGMVQTFVNAFARDGRYVVSFSATKTAGTDMKAKNVIITPAPIADQNLTAEQAGVVLTGLAVHEVSHTRYGRKTYNAIVRTFPGNGTAFRLSNLLDDIRIERRFVADYPGYAGIFTPTLEYVGAAGGKTTPKLTAPVNLAITATRYPTFGNWTPETLVEATWWNDWAARGSKEDAPKRHVEFIREALAHIVALKATTDKAEAPKPEPKSDAAPVEGEAAGQADDAPTQSGQANDSSDEDDAAEATESAAASADDATPTSEDEDASGSQGAANDMTDEELNDATRNDREANQLPSCSGSDAVDQAVKDNDVDAGDIKDLKDEAQSIIENERNIESDGHWNAIDVARSLRGITHGGERLGPSSMAMRYIRNAILRSRTGHTETSTFQKRGRLDQMGLERIARGDARIFERRTAPSPGKYLVWLMVDCSSSMSGKVEKAAQVAHAMATATGGTPSVRMAVWGWSYAFRASRANAGVAKVWETGQDTNEIFRISGLRMGGTPDAAIMAWSARAILKAVRHDETPVLIIASDGEGDATMTARVEEARRMGVVVKSVSFGYGFRADAQAARFGRGNYVPWMGSIIDTARPLADLFARITSGR